MMEDVRAGQVDCIIVKDLSRFGRNYIETGEYLEKIFPFLGVRFIAVNDGIDTADPASVDSLALHLKNLVNDVYARDISAKISSVLHGKQECGEFIGTWAAYGYQKIGIALLLMKKLHLLSGIFLHGECRGLAIRRLQGG